VQQEEQEQSFEVAPKSKQLALRLQYMQACACSPCFCPCMWFCQSPHTTSVVDCIHMTRTLLFQHTPPAAAVLLLLPHSSYLSWRSCCHELPTWSRLLSHQPVSDAACSRRRSCCSPSAAMLWCGVMCMMRLMCRVRALERATSREPLPDISRWLGISTCRAS
jgi:hypothetical protein